MGPFSGRLLSISIAMLPGSRTSKQRHISLDSRFMSQWMKAAKNSHAAIKHISASPCHSTTVGKGKKVNLKDKPQNLIENISTQFPRLTKKVESSGAGKSGDSKPKANRRRGRRKST